MDNIYITDCNKVSHLLDDYLDGLLTSKERVAVDGHASTCAACRALFARETVLRQTLRGLPAPDPSEMFFDNAIAQAVAHNQRRRWRMPGIALAASILLIFAVNLLHKPDTAPLQDIPGLAITLNQVQQVSLVFEAEQAMEDARFTVQLPEGIELSGYPGQREINWDGSLAQGNNLLVLPIEARSGRGGELIAYVTHTGKRKSFILRMDVLSPKDSPITSLEQKAASIMVM